MKRFIFSMLFLLTLVSSPAWSADTTNSGARGGAVVVSSSSQAVQVTDRIKQNLKVAVPTSATSPVCIFFLDNGIACSTITSGAAYIPCLPGGSGYEWNVREGWEGQVCAILESGSTPVTIQWRDPW